MKKSFKREVLIWKRISEIPQEIYDLYITQKNLYLYLEIYLTKKGFRLKNSLKHILSRCHYPKINCSKCLIYNKNSGCLTVKDPVFFERNPSQKNAKRTYNKLKQKYERIYKIVV